MLRELQITIDSQDCSDIVRFYGAVFQDVGLPILVNLTKNVRTNVVPSGRLLDLHGADGLFTGQVLPSSVQARREASGRSDRIHHGVGTFCRSRKLVKMTL